MFVRTQLSVGTIVVCFLAASVAGAQEPAAKPQVEVVFCLDTTGSMGGLIDAAKRKIWAIANQIAAGTPTPQVKIGLVAYRDRTDAYVTKVFDLTDDLDSIHGQLLSLRAEGGGDFPESVNQALHEAVTKISWSKNKKTLKLIFLVGDAPPHMDYADDVKYPVTCKLAAERDIIINTVQCGTHAETQRFWKEICRLAEGAYIQLDAAGGPVVALETPFDKDLARINAELAKSTLVFGNRLEQINAKIKANQAAALPTAVAADRAGFSSRTKQAASYDLLDNLRDGKVKLEQLKKDELPEELQEMSPAERQTYLKKLEQRRGDLLKQAAEFDQKRKEYLTKELQKQKNKTQDSFDFQVLRILQQQGNRNGTVHYAIEEKTK